MLFNLNSEFMIQEAMEGVEGIRFGGVNITNLRYADDAVLVAEKRRKMQKMIDKLNTTCKAYGMLDQYKKDKSDDYEWNGKTEGDAAVYSVGRGAFGTGVSF